MADFMLFSWPLIAVAMFAALGRERGLIWSVLVGYLFLPEARVHPLPGLPDYDKLLAISLGAVLGMAFFRTKTSWPAPGPGGPSRNAGPRDGDTIAGLTPGGGRVEIGSKSLLLLIVGILGLLAVASVMTMIDNRAPLVDAGRVRSGLSFRDVISLTSEVYIAVVPMLLAMLYLRTPQHFREVLVAIAVLGVAYAFLALIEVRLSPRLNVWVYGYFQHDWRQHLRGGFRPLVFLRHGLWLGFFLLTALLCAFALFRTERGPKRFAWLGAGLWILLVLLLSRNLGATMLAVVFIPLVLFLPRAAQAKVVMVVAVLFLTYPMVRQTELLPLDGFLDFVGGISEERRSSLEFRLVNETQMLARAAEKPVFGWGGWGRWRVINEKGQDVTVSDGIWIIILGERGWVGYVLFFGLLTFPLFYLSTPGMRRKASPEVMGLALIMAANLVYMVPNSTLSPVGWLITGTIAAFLRWRTVEAGSPESTETGAKPVSRYTRFPRSHVRSAAGPGG